jgi:hypothetical protein
LGKAIKTIFLCRYLHSEALRREIQEGLNVIETWNGANTFILYGKGGEIATNDLENQELTMLALHLLQICLVYMDLHFRQIKILLGMDVLRCLSPAMVRKELLMHLVAYDLIRALMQRASLIYQVPLGRLSFKGCLDSLHHFADAIHAAQAKPTRQRQLFDTLLLTIATDQVPLRPNRRFTGCGAERDRCGGGAGTRRA